MTVVYCAHCEEAFDGPEIWAHLKEAHGIDVDADPPAEWPDGSPVIIDESLSPDDFALDQSGCPCGEMDCPYQALSYPFCVGCGDHHRQPVAAAAGDPCPIDQWPEEF